MNEIILIIGIILSALNLFGAIWSKNIHSFLGWLVAIILYLNLLLNN